jgi:hypothetical protein
VPLASTSRLYFLAGTPHSSGRLPTAESRNNSGFLHFPNFADQRWVSRALLLDLDEWAGRGTAPPPSQYPSLAKGELVQRTAVRFPSTPLFPFATYMPQVWRLDFGPEFSTARTISIEPPTVGAAYTVLVPQVNADGNDLGGIRLPELAVPLGTYTGWNLTVPPLSSFGYLSGLVGGFEPFPLDKEQRATLGDSRLSIAERYRDRQDYLDRVKRAADDLVRQRFLLSADVPSVLEWTDRIWIAIVGAPSR